MKYETIKNLILEGYKEAKIAFLANASEDEVTNALNAFKSLVNRNQVTGNERNIDWWRKRGWEEFNRFVKRKSGEESITQMKRNTSKGKVFTLRNDDDWLIIVPLNKDAACHYGSKTDWCVSKRNQTYFESYFYRGNVTLVYFIDKKTDSKWAISITKTYDASTDSVDEDVHFFDQKDNNIDIDEFDIQTGLDANTYLKSIQESEELDRMIDEMRTEFRNTTEEIHERLLQFDQQVNTADNQHLTDNDFKEEREQLEKMIFKYPSRGSLTRYMAIITENFSNINVLPPLQPLLLRYASSATFRKKVIANLTLSAWKTIVEHWPVDLEWFNEVPEEIQVYVAEHPTEYAISTVFAYINNISPKAIGVITRANPLRGMEVLRNYCVSKRHADTSNIDECEQAVADGLTSAHDVYYALSDLISYAEYYREERVLPFEPFIVKDIDHALRYLKTMVKDRWPLLEKEIEGDNVLCMKYAMTLAKLGIQWPEGEKYFSSSPEDSFSYAMMYKKRFPAGEAVMKTNPQLWEIYAKHFNIE